MLDRSTRLAIQERVEKFVQKEGFIFVDFQYRPGRNKDTLRFLLDRPGGITLDECARLNEGISPLLEGIGGLDKSYVLEVCSPGPERTLDNKEDYRRALGREVRLKLSGESEEFLTGTLKEMTDKGLLLLGSAGLHEVEWDRIINGRIIYKF